MTYIHAKKPPSVSTSSLEQEAAQIPRFYSLMDFESRGVAPPMPPNGHIPNGGPFWHMFPSDFLGYVAAEKDKQRLADENYIQKWLTLLGVTHG